MTKEELRLEALKLSLEYVTHNVYFSEQTVIDCAKTFMDFIEDKQ